MDKWKHPVVTVSLITAFCLLGDSMLYIVLPIYWKEAGLQSLIEVGILLSVNRFVRLPMNPLVGWLYHRLSLRKGLLIAIVLSVTATVGYGLANSFWIWFILRCIWGMAWSLLKLGGYFTVILCAEDSNRGKWMGTYNGLYRLGSLFGMLLGGFLASTWGITGVTFLFGFTPFLAIPFLFISFEDSHVTNQSRKKLHWNQETKTWLFSRQVMQAVVSGLLIAMLFQGILTSTLSYVIEYHHFELAMLGFVVAGSALSGLLQAFRWTWEPFLATNIGKWSDGEKGRKPYLVIFLFIAGITYSLIPLEVPLLIWLPIVIVLLISATALTTLIDAIASDAAKEGNTVVFMTIYSMMIDMGAALGPLLGYAVIRLQNGLWLTYGGAALILIGVGILWTIRTRESGN
nr:MFS transporter [Ammoniphilus resinae]